MNFQDKELGVDNKLINGLLQTLADRKKHHVGYKELTAPKKRELEHQWAKEFLYEAGVKFGGD